MLSLKKYLISDSIITTYLFLWERKDLNFLRWFKFGGREEKREGTTFLTPALRQKMLLLSNSYKIIVGNRFFLKLLEKLNYIL